MEHSRSCDTGDTAQQRKAVGFLAGHARTKIKTLQPVQRSSTLASVYSEARRFIPKSWQRFSFRGNAELMPKTKSCVICVLRLTSDWSKGHPLASDSRGRM